MTMDIQERLMIDPILSKKKIEIVATRFLRGDRDNDGDYRYELAVAMRRLGKRWPKGSYHVRAYDTIGLMVVDSYVSENKSLDPDARHLSASFYGPEVERAEVVFESADEPDAHADEWTNLDIRRDQRGEEILSLEARGLRARAHPDFTYNNQTLIQVTGEVVPTFGLPLPSGLRAQVSVLDSTGAVISTGQFNLANGPLGSRPLDATVNIYSHDEAEAVRVEFFKD